jgi:hypothetical protein
MQKMGKNMLDLNKLAVFLNSIVASPYAIVEV